jgi:hypothetical protein
MTGRNFQVFRVLRSTLRMKVQADSRSRGQKELFVEKRMVSWGHAGGPGNLWYHELGWNLGFYSLFVYCQRVEMSLRSRQMFPGKKCLLGQLSPFGTSCCPSFRLSNAYTN